MHYVGVADNKSEQLISLHGQITTLKLENENLREQLKVNHIIHSRISRLALAQFYEATDNACTNVFHLDFEQSLIFLRKVTARENHTRGRRAAINDSVSPYPLF